MWAISLSDIFNAILDGIGGLFSSLWYADIPTPNEEVMGFIRAFIFIVIAAFLTYRMIVDTRDSFLKFQIKHGWIDKGTQLMAAFICTLIGLVAFGFFVFLIYFAGTAFFA